MASIFDYRKFLKQEQGRALLSYLPAKLRYDVPESNMTGNQLYANLLPRALNELGYVVDYIDWQDTSFKPDKQYDLFLGHGGYNFVKYAHAKKNIYFSTGFEQTAFNRLEQERFDNLYQRRGVRLQPDRKITTDEVSAYKCADAIITLGNEVTAASFAEYPRVYAIGGATAPVGQDLNNKNYDRGRNNFLFYSGNGAIHKGLDLLVEAFEGTDLFLHVCISDVDTHIVQNIYPNWHNVIFYGKIDIYSEVFETLMEMCNWVISATCCEGCPSAILECMAHGLIPVVTENASINIGNFGCYFDDGKWLNNLSIMEREIIEIMSGRAQKEAQTYYSPAAFLQRLKDAIQEIV